MLSDRDLLVVAGGLLAGLDPARAGASQVVGVMSTDVLAVDPDTDLGEVVSIMLEERVGAVPVVMPGTRELVGIISYIDLLAAARPFFEEEE
jgi:acetoin utilization protein AcuB